MNAGGKLQVGAEGTKGMWIKAFPSKGKQGEDFLTLLLDAEGLGIIIWTYKYKY